MNEKEIRDCQYHGKVEFRKDSSGERFRFRCVKCSSEAVQRRRVKLKELAIEYMGGSCQHCGYFKCKEALEFHHKDPSEKDFGIGAKGYTRSFDKVKVELDKCIMLCANCHREEHVRLKIQ